MSRRKDRHLRRNFTKDHAEDQRLKAERPALPAGLQSVTLDLIDPGGHRLIRVGRYFWDDPRNPKGEREFWWQAPHAPRSLYRRPPLQIGPRVWFRTEDEPDGIEWRTLWFRCLVCRDSGHAEFSWIAADDIRGRLVAMDRAARVDQVPRRESVDTVGYWDGMPLY